MTESYRWWTYHIILDHIMPSENVSVHLWLHHAINELLTAHVINVHIMTTHNTSWHLATHHVVSRHIMYHVVYEHDVWAYGTWNMEHTFDSPSIPGGLWCFAHGTGWFITRTLDTDARRWLLTKNIISLLYNDKLTSSGCSTDRPIRQTSYFGPSG